MKVKDFTDKARKRLARAIDADKENRADALDDLKNLAGMIFPEEVRRQREAEGRPCLVDNRHTQFLRQVTGDIRNSNPSINILPANEDTSDDMAELVEGLIRQIQYECDASSVYESAGESAAACGMGYFRVLSDYIHEDTFDQEIQIKRIDNPFSVYFDPEARDPTRSDAQFCFITDRMTEDDFKAAYPGKSSTPVDADGKTDNLEHWRDAGDVIIAEYYYRETEKKTLYLYPGGVRSWVKNETLAPVSERQVSVDKIMWAKVSATDILEGPTEVAGKYIPVIAVMGEELYIGTRVYRSGVIRHAKDPVRLLNYSQNALAEIVALQPKAPFMATAKQIGPYKDMYAGANISNSPVLLYDNDPNAAGPPQRVQPPVASPGLLQMIALAADSTKATTGIYDAGLGNRSNEQSGVAIRQRQAESDLATSIYSDNVAKAVAQCGRVVVGMVPKIYDTTRVLRILGKDETQKMVAVNQPLAGTETGEMQNDMTIGRFDVRVSVGPNYTTKRQQTAESMMAFIQAFPAAAPLIGDLVAKNMEWPGADQMAERLKKALPPGIAEADDKDAELQAAVEQQVQQMAPQIEQQVLQSAAAREAEAKARQAEAQAIKAEAEAQKAQIEAAMPPQPVTV